jgi:ABC-2 type transport system ATP-binding protein
MIQIENLRKEYDDVVAVNDLTLAIPPGEIYGLIGPNGAGKTTLIRMAAGLLTPTNGRVVVDGVDVQAEPERALRSIGYLADFFAVYEDLTVWEYLDYFAHAYKMPSEQIPRRIEAVINDVRLDVKRNQLIKGLSRGMKQRLGIGRAIIHRPKVLLLDEPASGLDPKARVDLRNVLLELQAQGTTILISSHILTELEGFCTLIGIMEKGSMVRSGSIASITAQTGVPHLTLRIEWLPGSAAAAKAYFAAHPSINHLKFDNAGAVLHFGGGEDQLSVLMQDLLSAGVKLTSFSLVRQTVEELYLKISHHEVM